MSDSGGMAAIQYRAALSSLISANRQPELALQLLLQTVDGLPSDSSAQSTSTAVHAAAAQQVAVVQNPVPLDNSNPGQIIDIVA